MTSKLFAFFVSVYLINILVIFVSSRSLFSKKKIINNVTRIFSNTHNKNSNKLGNNEDNYSYSLLIDNDLFKKFDNSSYKYRFIKLQNELEVFLISSSEPTDSMAILDVKAGAFLEPESIPGLAHYLEHMLFMGTNEYPGANIGQFIGLHGGYINGVTSLKGTTYMFEINKLFYEEMLMRFSSMFKNPLFDKKYLKKELIAIENEFKLAEPVSVLDILLECVNRNGFKFFLGNFYTLERMPKFNGINARNEMINFFNNEYSSNRMVLLLAGNHSLDELTEFATKYFSDIKNKKLPIISQSTLPKDKYISNYLLKKIIVINSPYQSKCLIYFPLEISLTKHKYNIVMIFIQEYISESSKSLKEYLYNNKFISKMEVLRNDYFFENFLEFHLYLTEKGETNILLIFELFFSAFKHLSEVEPNMEFYENFKKDLLSKLKVKIDLRNECNNILETYLRYECKPEDVLIYHYSTFDFEKNIYDQIISKIIPENMFIIFIKQKLRDSINNSEFSLNFALNSATNIKLVNEYRKKYLKVNEESLFDCKITFKDFAKGKYTGAEYIKKELNPYLISYLSKVRKYFIFEKFEIDLEANYGNYHFTIPNKIIEIDRKEIPVRLNYLIENSIVNGSIKTGNYYRFYKNFLYYPIKDSNIEYVKFALSFEFPINKTYYNSNLNKYNTRKLILLHNFFEEMLRRFLEEKKKLFKAQLIIHKSELLNLLKMNSLNFEIATFPSQISEIMINLANFIKSLHRYLNNFEFNIIKNKIIYIYSSFGTDSYYMKIYNTILTKIKYNYSFSQDLMLEELNGIEIQDVIDYSKFLVKYFKINGFIIGNIKESEIAKIMESFMQIIGRSPSHLHFNNYYRSASCLISQKYIPSQNESIENLQTFDFLSLKSSKIYYYFPSKLQMFENNVVFFEIFIGTNSIHNQIFAQILIRIINKEYFYYMRTKQKLGYVARVENNYISHNNSSIKFTIVSSTENIKTLSKYTLNFWSKCNSPNSKLITESKFQVSKDLSLKIFNRFPNSLIDIESEFIPIFYDKEFDFDRREKGIQILEQISFEKFKSWLKNLYSTSNYLIFCFQSISKLKEDEIKELSRFVPNKFTRQNSSKPLFNYPGVKTYSKKQLFEIN